MRSCSSGPGPREPFNAHLEGISGVDAPSHDGKTVLKLTEEVKAKFRERFAMVKEPGSMTDFLLRPSKLLRAWSATQNAGKWGIERTHQMRAAVSTTKPGRIILADGADDLAQALTSSGLHKDLVHSFQALVLFPIFIPVTADGALAAHQAWKSVFEDNEVSQQLVQERAEALHAQLERRGGWTLAEIIHRTHVMLDRDQGLRKWQRERLGSSSDAGAPVEFGREVELATRMFNTVTAAAAKLRPNASDTALAWHPEYLRLKARCRASGEPFDEAVGAAVGELVEGLLRLHEDFGHEPGSEVDLPYDEALHSAEVHDFGTRLRWDTDAVQLDLDRLAHQLGQLELARAQRWHARLDYLAAPSAAMGTGLMSHAMAFFQAAACSNLARMSRLANGLLTAADPVLVVGQCFMALYGMGSVAHGMALEGRYARIGKGLKETRESLETALGVDGAKVMLSALTGLRRCNRRGKVCSGALLSLGQSCMVLGGPFGPLGLPAVVAGAGLTLFGIGGSLHHEGVMHEQFTVRSEAVDKPAFWRSVQDGGSASLLERVAVSVRAYRLRAVACSVWLRIWYRANRLLRRGGNRTQLFGAMRKQGFSSNPVAQLGQLLAKDYAAPHLADFKQLAHGLLANKYFLNYFRELQQRWTPPPGERQPVDDDTVFGLRQEMAYISAFFTRFAAEGAEPTDTGVSHSQWLATALQQSVRAAQEFREQSVGGRARTLHAEIELLEVSEKLHQELASRAFISKAYSGTNPHDAFFDIEHVSGKRGVFIPVVDMLVPGRDHLVQRNVQQRAYMFRTEDFLEALDMVGGPSEHPRFQGPPGLQELRDLKSRPPRRRRPRPAEPGPEVRKCFGWKPWRPRQESKEQRDQRVQKAVAVASDRRQAEGNKRRQRSEHNKQKLREELDDATSRLAEVIESHQRAVEKAVFYDYAQRVEGGINYLTEAVFSVAYMEQISKGRAPASSTSSATGEGLLPTLFAPNAANTEASATASASSTSFSPERVEI